MKAHVPSCCPPQKACPPRYLLPRVVASARENIRMMQARLVVNGLPISVCKPIQIVSVEASQQEPTFRQEGGGCVAVTIPLNVWVTDARGQNLCGSSSVTVRARLWTGQGCGCPSTGTFHALAQVRLCGCACTVDGCTFDAPLSVMLELYAVRLEPCGHSPLANPCADDCCPMDTRPMYPQPNYFC